MFGGLKMKFADKVNEIFVRGNHNQQDKLKRKKINRLKRIRKCNGKNMRPSVSTTNGQVKVKCVPVNRQKARKMKRVMRIRKAKVSQFRKSMAKARDTKKFRNIIKK